MVWSPQFTVLDATTIADNLLAYILANQAAALTWAGGTTLKELRPASVKITDPDAPMLPSISIEGDSERPEDDGGSTITTIYTATFEIWVENADPDAVRADAKKYLRALKTMMQDCPNATVIANTDAGVIEDRLRPIVEMPPMRSTENETHFFQSFQITAGFRLIAGAEY
jgi:hypothetical protein